MLQLTETKVVSVNDNFVSVPLTLFLSTGYEPVKLMQLVTSKINNVCLEFLNNQKFESLCTELSFSDRPLHPVSVHAIRNGRRKMEDRHVVIQDLNTICSIRVSNSVGGVLGR